MNERRTESVESFERGMLSGRGWKIALAGLAAAVLLAWSGHRTELDRAGAATAEGIAQAVGLKDDSDVGRGAHRFFSNALPFEFATETAVSRLPDFNRDDLLPWEYVETRPVEAYDEATQSLVTIGEERVLINRFGYLWYVLGLMIKTLEIAMWGTVIAATVGIPLAWLSASNMTPHPAIRHLARAFCSFSRAIPELVAAMLLVLMYGFGPAAGVLALGFHCAGFLGKFYADDMENIDRGPQEALRCSGASRLKVFRYAILPQVMPQWLAYTNYILERNVRTATVIGIVGAGGIGVELWGRWDMSDYQRVSTILLVIFVTVFALEHITQSVRRTLIR